MPAKYRDVRRHQLALILIGIAIANHGDRKKLFSMLNLDTIVGPRDRACLQAILDNDREGVQGFLLSLGVVCGDSPALDAIVGHLREQWEEDELEITLRAIIGGSLVEHLDAAEKRLEAALATVRNAKSPKLTQENNRAEHDG